MVTVVFMVFSILQQSLQNTGNNWCKGENAKSLRKICERGYGFSLTRISPYKDRIVDSVRMREITAQPKFSFSYILRSEWLNLN